MRGQAAPLTVAEARALLGLDAAAHGPALTAAFRRAVKAARPDLPGGDEATFRRVIAAHDLLKRLDAPLALPAPAVRQPALCDMGDARGPGGVAAGNRGDALNLQAIDA